MSSIVEVNGVDSERKLAAMRWSDAAVRGQRYEWRELWRYRDLVQAFVVRDLHVRFRQTLLGALWILIQPLGHTLVFSGFFHLFGSAPADSAVPYPIVLLTGAILWQMFVQCIQQSTMSLSNNQQLVTKTYFPRLLLPIAAVVTPYIDFLIGWSGLIAMSLWFGVELRWTWAITPLLGLLVLGVGFSLGVWLSMLNALYRDVTSLVPFALQMGFFLSPIVYQTSVLIPEKYRAIAALNPLLSIIDLFRAAWLGQPLPTITMVLVSVATTSIVLYSGLRFFMHTEDIVADRV